MRITQGYLDQLECEALRLSTQAEHAHARGDFTESRRLDQEAKARRARILRLQTERTDGVRFG